MPDPIPMLAPSYGTLQALLLEHLRDKPNMLALTAGIAAEADRLDAANHELWNLYDIDTIVGAQLDVLGKIANEPRALRADSVYRPVLKALFRSQVSGTPEDVLTAVKQRTGATSVTYLPDYPAGYWVVPVGGDASLLTQEFLDMISPAGVRGYLPCYLSMESPPSEDPEEALLFEDGDWILIEGPCPAPDAGWGIGWGELWGG